MAKNNFRIEFTENITKQIELYKKKLGLEESSGIDFRAKQKVGLQLINWVVNGSSKSSRVPPIKEGILRGSGSVFVGDKMVGDTKGLYGNGKGNPNTSHNAKFNTVTIGFNTAYAARLHETTWIPGGKKPSKQATKNPNILGDVGNKYIELHLKADGLSLTKLWAAFVKGEMG